jgi:hypothetical protein
MSRVWRRATIGQEYDFNVALVSDANTHRVDDGDLVLLDDAGIGHADMREIRLIQAGSAG